MHNKYIIVPCRADQLFRNIYLSIVHLRTTCYDAVIVSMERLIDIWNCAKYINNILNMIIK